MKADNESRALTVVGPRAAFARARDEAAARAELTIAANMTEVAAGNIARAHALLESAIGQETAIRDSAIRQVRVLLQKCMEELGAVLEEIPSPAIIAEVKR